MKNLTEQFNELLTDDSILNEAFDTKIKFKKTGDHYEAETEIANRKVMIFVKRRFEFKDRQSYDYKFVVFDETGSIPQTSIDHFPGSQKVWFYGISGILSFIEQFDPDELRYEAHWDTEKNPKRRRNVYVNASEKFVSENPDYELEIEDREKDKMTVIFLRKKEFK